jgi:amidase
MSVSGLPLTAGTFPQLLSPDSKHPISTIDAVVVSRVLDAGATIEGTGTCENFSLSPLSFTSANGMVSNPWLPGEGYTVGGSSSGCAALVAISVIKEWRERNGIKVEAAEKELGEGVDMALGGDQGGSIRIPAAYTGLYGLKATHGLIPYTGVVSLHPMVDHCGPMTKNLADLAVLLGVLAGYDGIDPRIGAEAPLRDDVKDYKKLLDDWVAIKRKSGEWTSETAGKGLKIGVLKESFEVPGLTEQMSLVVKRSISRFEAMGATVKEVSVPMHLLGGALWTVASRAQIPQLAFHNMPSPYLAHPLPNFNPPPMNQEFYDLLTKHNPAPVNVVFNATYLSEYRRDSASVTAKTHMHIYQLRAAYDAVLEECDVLITPVNPRVGARHPGLEDGVMVKTQAALGTTLNTCPFNITGHPALAMPVGWGEVEDGGGKLPVAMQIVGKRWDEETILKVAAAWEVGGIGLDSY